MSTDYSTRVAWQSRRRGAVALAALCMLGVPYAVGAQGRVMDASDTASYEFNDAHFHLTNYIQRGIDLRAFLDMMGARVGHVALFGIPLQQQWSPRVDGDHPPTYYLNTDAPLYYYSFTDAYIAMAYRSLSPSERTRF
ncbi:MAG TPA: hypothetical protein VJW73_08370, partial [Gemmatimonadaceae bacterium]|nr:hypothetical protein [Gemmatimonadaceae bacterium]